MDSGSTSGNNHQYHSAQWSRLLQRRTSSAAAVPTTPNSLPSTPSAPTTAAEYFPDYLLQQQLSISQAQLAQYSKLISPGRTTRIQPSPLHPVVSTPHIEAIRGESQSPRFRAGSSQDKSKKAGTQGGHGNKKGEQHTGTGERPVLAIMEPRTDRKKSMVLSTEALTPKPGPRQAGSGFTQQSNSVPSTPHQRPRQYSFDSREPSPCAPVNHSPRSAYSESNSTLPSLRPLPPRFGGCRYETAPQFGKRRMPYNIGADLLEKANPETVKPKLTPEQDRTLSKDMQELYRQLLPTPNCEANRKKFIKKLEKLLNDEWPGHDIQVHMFGSSGNLLCSDDSDVDICITTPWKELESVCKLAELLAKHGMEKVICVSSAKVPIVKIWDPELRLACDMNVNNTLALENTRMIKTYVEIDPRVRPLAMIVKHWTRRRILNDAAFGGTLSSYTWICMIITFLQLRTPPLLPSLHQRPHQKLPTTNGTESSFADDVESLKTFGKNNKETLGELLFHFFRFYGHEFDYEKYVLSVRIGKLVGKVEKGWHITANNRLCVEEPFNTNRNLSNTADDTSVRGLHMEIRRAFDLIAEAKLEECCEQYVYPKEEERIFEKAKPQPKPVLTAPIPPRRGNQRSGKNAQSRTQGNGNRRASSGAASGIFDTNTTNFNLAPGVPVAAPADNWIHAQNVQKQIHNDLYHKFSALQMQENSLRMQLYQRSQQALQAAHAQAQAMAQGGMNPNGALSNQHGNEQINLGNSLDNPPLSAPPRPEYYYYPVQYTGGQPMYMSQNPSTYPSSPAMSSGPPELRRSLHRSNVNGNPGNMSGVPNGSLRSHSQPGTRTGLGLTVPNQHMNGTQQSHRKFSGMITDENMEPGLEIDAVSLGESPPETSLPKEYVGYYVNESQSSVRRAPGQNMTIGTFGDTSGRPRRQSTDQFPQAMILDRLRRTSRSPSPMGHSRAYSGGAYSAPLVSTAQFAAQSNLRSQDAQAPLIVNGSNPSSVAEDFQSASSDGTQQAEYNKEFQHRSFQLEDGAGRESYQQSPPVVNGSLSGPANIVLPPSNGTQATSLPAVPSTPTNPTRNPESTNASRSSPNGNQRLARQPQIASMVPLDIAGPHDTKRDDLSHLSPVYETRSPSPSAIRKFESDAKASDVPSKLSERRPDKPVVAKQPGKNGNANSQQKQVNAPSKANGHTRSAKSEGGASGQWQTTSTKKNKKGNSGNSKAAIANHLPSEQLPKRDGERKGG